MLFISPQKLFSFSRYLSFCLYFLVIAKSGLIRKIRLISKFINLLRSLLITLLNKQMLCTYYPISQEVKAIRQWNFGQLLEYNMRNIFVEKSYTKCGEETIPRSFSKKLKLSISLDQQPKVLYILFLSYAKLRTIKIYWN